MTAELLKDEGTHYIHSDLGQLGLQLAAAFGLGLLVAAVHYLTRAPGKRADRPFLATLVLLSVLIALVTLVIGSSIARAFSLVGALAIIRFRTVVEDTRDTAFVIYAVVVGMAAGTGRPEAGLIATPLVFVAAWIFRPQRMPVEMPETLLVVRFSVGRQPDHKLEEVLRQHLAGSRLIGLATARGGAALDVTYAVQPLSPQKTITLVAELNQIEGVQSVELKGS